MKEKLKILQTIHIALSIGVIMAYVVMHSINEELSLFDGTNFSNDDYFYIIIPFIAYIISNTIYKLMLKSTDKNADEDFNFNIFQTASIARWAILEGSAFLILFLKPNFIIFGIVLIVYLIILRPTEQKFTNDINRL